MEYMVRDAFWADGRAIVLLDPDAFLDMPTYGVARRRAASRCRTFAPIRPPARMLWQAEQPEVDDHYYRIESREPLVALSFSAFRCDLDLSNGRILKKDQPEVAAQAISGITSNETAVTMTIAARFTRHPAPIISCIVSRPVPNTIAFGGVPTGSMNPQDAASATGTTSCETG